MMKRIFAFFGVLALGAGAPLWAQNAPQPMPDEPLRVEPMPQDVVEGEAYFLQKIALPRGAKLHVSLVGRVAGAEYLPLATTIVPARNGITPFRLLVPQGLSPVGPYRVRAWIVADDRLWMDGAKPQTSINSLADKPRVRLKIVAAPQNIDGFGDGRPMNPAGMAQPMAGEPMAGEPYLVRGVVEKLDRRALAANAQIEVKLLDVSLADAPAKTLGVQRFSINGKQLPVPFAIAIQIADVKEGRRVSLSVRITEKGRLTFISDAEVPVTPKNVRTAFVVKVVAVGGG